MIRQHGGFTLMEFLLGLFILTVAISAGLTATTHSLKTIRIMQARTTLIAASHNALKRYQALAYDDAALAPGATHTIDNIQPLDGDDDQTLPEGTTITVAICGQNPTPPYDCSTIQDAFRLKKITVRTENPTYPVPLTILAALVTDGPTSSPAGGGGGGEGGGGIPLGP